MNAHRLQVATARTLFVLLLWLPLSVAGAHAQDPATDFKTNCAACHTIGGGRLAGPDLKGVTERQSRAWLARFIVEPSVVMESGDSYALKIRDEARGLIMPTIPGMSLDRAKALLDLIEAESAMEESKFGGLKMSERPFSGDDVRLGRELFLGIRSLQGGGPACVSCHSVSGIGVLAGGGLAPELSAVFGRLNGRKGLSTWLAAPATNTMQALFESKSLEAESEILPLVAYFADLAGSPAEPSQASTLIFILLGLGGTAALLMVFDALWKARLRGVRRPLVSGTSAEA